MDLYTVCLMFFGCYLSRLSQVTRVPCGVITYLRAPGRRYLSLGHGELMEDWVPK